MPHDRRALKKHLAPPYVKPSSNALGIVMLFGVCMLLLAWYFNSTNYLTSSVILFVALGLILIINSILLRFDFAQSFLIKYGIVMLKTKHFVKLIESISHFGKIFEIICLLGSILGFGLVGVDYWFGRKLGGWKRIAVLLVSAVILAVFFDTFCKILFSVPILAPLYIPSLIGFVILGFGGMSLTILIGYGVLAVIGLFTQKQLCPSVAPVIPGVEIPGMGVAIPLIGWVSLALVLIIHEASHGVMMAYYREKIKSVGLLVAGFLPLGAFVEQDDKTFEKLEDKKAIMVLSAGSASNLLMVAVAYILLIGFYMAVTPLAPSIEQEFNKTYDGVQIVKVSDKVSFCGIDANAPAKGKLFAKDIIKQVNGVDINGIIVINQVFRDANGDINFTVERINPDTNLSSDVNVSVTPYKFEDLGIKRIGVEFGAIKTGYEPKGEIVLLQLIISNIGMILTLVVIIGFAAGSFNYFPANPFDGGRMAKIMLAPYFVFIGFNKEETGKLIGRIFIWLLIISLTMNLIPYLTMFF
ncbi:MAG: site-2 protease family protein [archaeon]|jgi:membrane-associated protease RseP (regulator of RpoE activity)